MSECAALPLTLTLSPQAGRGDDLFCSDLSSLGWVTDGANFRHPLLPVGEKVPDRADEGAEERSDADHEREAKDSFPVLRAPLIRPFGPPSPRGEKGRANPCP
ncbi:hypothetical protein GGE67_000853 [Rhizobium leucaenae]|uniref:Uncharacterized protein n=1 Tax=Rhizobium leucaenae TaxID=29450 RepID=A0A7W7EK89_9HYPH|nr:hypothetical protein [Rhizobium leucaenae]MBB6300250.1 hypothetical protein [Rhizobium leucaenae]